MGVVLIEKVFKTKRINDNSSGVNTNRKKEQNLGPVAFQNYKNYGNEAKTLKKKY